MDLSKQDYRKFYIATGTCIATALAVSVVAVIGLPPGSGMVIFAAVLLLIAGLFFLLWPTIRRQDLDSIETLPGVLEEVRKLGREYYRNTTAIQENSAAVKQFNDDLGSKMDELLPLRKPLEELLLQQRQENMTLRAELDVWQKTVVQYFE